MMDYVGHLRYVWPNHPEKDATAVERYENMGGQNDPLGGEVGQEQTWGPNIQLPPQIDSEIASHLVKMPPKIRDAYLALLGPVMPDSNMGWR